MTVVGIYLLEFTLQVSFILKLEQIQLTSRNVNENIDDPSNNHALN